MLTQIHLAVGMLSLKQGYLKRVFETDAYFMQLQFPLLFPLGDDGYHTEIPLRNNNRSRPPPMDHDDIDNTRITRERVTMKEYYSSKLMIRHNEGNIFIKSSSVSYLSSIKYNLKHHVLLFISP